MLFNSAIVYQLLEIFSENELVAGVEKRRFQPATGMMEESYGWIPYASNDEDKEADLIYKMGSIYMITLQIQTKIIPAAVINEMAQREVAELIRNGGRVSPKDMKKMKESIRIAMLPKALSRYGRVTGYIDFDRKELIVGTSSASQAEKYLNTLRSGLGKLAIHEIRGETSPSSIMTSWFKGDSFPEKVVMGHSIVVKETTEGGSKGSFSKQDLSSSEIMECLDNGKQVDKIELLWNDYLSFSINSNLVLSKIKPMESNTDVYDSGVETDGSDGIIADLYLTVASLRTLLPELYKWFEIEVPQVVDVESLSNHESSVFTDSDDADYDNGDVYSSDSDDFSEED